VRRRAEGTPVAYLLGRREFYALSFQVTPAVLIPRPETEFVVVELLDRAAEHTHNDRPLQILDVGTGSGIIAVCAAKHLPDCRVTAVDISREALAVAARNAAEHGVEHRIDFVQSDLLSGLQQDLTLDFVVSNPPYVAESELANLAQEIRCHEPREALVAGPTGTEVIARLIPQAAQRLENGGWLIVEVSPMIERDVRDLIANNGGFDEPRTVKDLAQLPRVIACQRKR
jgi:release factor glutamine methyltransferase